MIGIFSNNLCKRNPYLSVLVGLPVRFRPSSPEGLTCIGGWGCKPTAQKPRRLAESWGLPYVALEDGFLRSLDLGVNGAPALSLVIDSVGIYYDATRPSQLENLLNQEGNLPESALREASQAMQEIVRLGLSKYNHAPVLAQGFFKGGGSRVLVLDQTRNDMSVQLGLADERSFAAMFDAALAENPDAEVVVKTHPDVLAGKKLGYLGSVAHPRVRLLAEDIQPSSLLQQVDRIYTVTSQMGFEALMHGKPVTCFGMPFYAGWGVTEDRVSCPRRVRLRTVLEIFTAAYVLYSRYANPFTGQRCSIREIIKVLSLARQRNEENRTPTICVGFKRWKRPQARAFLGSTAQRPVFRSSTGRALREAKEKKGRIVVWASQEPADLAKEAEAVGVQFLRMEDGFLRSVGLGSDFHHPYSLILDQLGIYYDATRPSRLEEILEQGGFGPELLKRAESLRKTIVARGLTKYNVGKAVESLPELPTNRRIILVPGQVENDASIRLGCVDVRTNLDLLKAVRAGNPEACIIFKPHPDVESGNRPGRVSDNVAMSWCDLVVKHMSMAGLFPHVHEIHTMTSLTGFEALLRGLSVHTYGRPFYAGWGLTKDRQEFRGRTRKVNLDELVAGALVIYPWYFDWAANLPCEVEVVIARLEAASGGQEMPQSGFYRKIVRFLHYLSRIVRS